MRLAISARAVAAFSVAPSTRPSGCFSPVAFDADRRHQQRVVGHVYAVDLDDHEVEMVEPARHPLPHARRRQPDEAARGRRFRQTGAPRGRHVAPGQAHRPLEFARGDGDQHLVHRPFAEPILPDRALPTRQHALLSVEAANARTLDIDLTAVKADLALRPPPSMRLPAFAPRMARAANRLGVLLHHFAQRLDPRRKAKSLKARRQPASASLFKACVGIAVDVIAFFMALLSFSWNQHPEPTGSRRATPLLPFQHPPGHPH